MIASTGQTKIRIAALTSPGGFSGLPDAVLHELARFADVVAEIDGLQAPLWNRLIIAGRTFYPRRKEWAKRFYSALGRHTKRPDTLRKRIRRCERMLAALKGSYDLVYQFGALFGALERPTSCPLVMHIDFTTKLAGRYFPGWLPPSSEETQEWNDIEGEMYRNADLVLVMNDLVRESVVSDYGASPQRVSSVGMGAHIELLADDFVKLPRHTLIFPGHDFGRHGGDAAVRVFQAVRRVIPDASLQLATNHFIQAPGVENLGIISRARFAMALRDAAVALMPAHVGGYQAVTEAMAAKCLCVVVDRNPHLQGLIRNEVTGLSFPHSDISEAAERIAQYLMDPTRLAEMGNKAREHVFRECTWTSVAARIWDQIGTHLRLAGT